MTSTINVKSAGARGDGRTDDTEAIDFAISQTQEDDALYFPEGVYIVTDRIGIPPRGMEIYGDGRDVTIIQPSLEIDTGAPLPGLLAIGNPDGVGRPRMHIHDLSLLCYRRAEKGLQIYGRVAPQSRFHDFSIERATYGIHHDPTPSPPPSPGRSQYATYQCIWENFFISGCDTGILMSETTFMGTSHYKDFWVQECELGLDIRNPEGSANGSFMITNALAQSNKGPLMKINGGHIIQFQGGWFENNGRVTGEPDILLGNTYGTARNILAMTGSRFGSESTEQANQRSVRIEWFGPYADLNMHSCFWISGQTIDMQGAVSSYIKAYGTWRQPTLNTPAGRVTWL